MKEKVKQTMGRLRKSVRAAGVGLSTLAASFFMSAPAYAAGVEDSQMSRDVQWKCQYEDALIQPPRGVLDINMGNYASGGR